MMNNFNIYLKPITVDFALFSMLNFFYFIQIESSLYFLCNIKISKHPLKLQNISSFKRYNGRQLVLDVLFLKNEEVWNIFKI